ncbi:hypothetical protein QM565_10970 [Geitlerinema splendidum]|nr:hypothetical protein [Geitlerinema splendidum]
MRSNSNGLASVCVADDRYRINQGAIAILDEIERELSQWYGDRRLAV